MNGSTDTKYDLIIEAGKNRSQYWIDIWRYRELFFFLAWKDFLVRYKQTAVGIVWSVIRPLLTIIIFTFIFGKVAKLPSNGIPYPILVYAAMLPWQFFSTSLNEGSNSLISNANLLTKIYFPRLIVPTSNLLVNSIDFLISFGLLCIIMTWYQFVPNWKIIFIPFFLILSITTSLGLAYFISSINVKYRDFKYIVPFMIQLGLYISPVGFSSAIIPEQWRLLYSINPMVGVIDGFRWAILGNQNIYLPGLILSIGLALFLFVFGIWSFRRREQEFADII